MTDRNAGEDAFGGRRAAGAFSRAGALPPYDGDGAPPSNVGHDPMCDRTAKA